MSTPVAILLGIIIALAALCTLAAFVLLGAAEVFGVIEAATGLQLGGKTPTKLMVMTDIHYLSPQLTDNGAYFTKIVTSGDGKTMFVIEDLADAFIQKVLDEAPDALILSGDLSFNGEKQSHLDFAAKLTTLTDAGIAVFALPGNHDLNYSQAAKFEGDSYTLVDSVSPAEFREIYAAFGYSGESLLAADENSLSYMAQLSETQALLFIDVNSVLTGVMNDEILAFAEAQLIAARDAGLQVIAVSHQSLMDHNSMLSFGYTIIKGDALLALYEKYGVLCNLSGHIHMQHIAVSDGDGNSNGAGEGNSEDGNNGVGGVADIATNALSVYPNHYGVLHWGEDEITYDAESLDIPLWSETSEAATSGCETFADYSYEFFQNDHSGQFTEALSADYTTDEIAAITDWAGETNAYYFAGRRDLITPDDGALHALEDSGVFFGTYLATIFEDDAENDTEWTNVGET